MSKRRRAWDSRGHPTVEVAVALVGGVKGTAMAPGSASVRTGERLIYETAASDLRGSTSRALSTMSMDK